MAPQIPKNTTPDQGPADAALRTNGKSGYTTGLRDWDLATGGIFAGQLVIIGGTTSVGKSVVGLQIARANAKSGVPVLFFTFEMLGEDVMRRVMSAECTIPTDRVYLPQQSLTDADWAKISEVTPLLADWNFYVSPAPEATVESVLATMRSHQRRYPGMLVVIDYLQLLTTAGASTSRREQAAAITRQLKTAALSLQIPIVVVSQLELPPESQSGRPPSMADLSEVGVKDEDVDQVVLLHREDLYDKASPRAGEMDVNIAKTRSGRTREISVAAQLRYMRVLDIPAC